MFDLRPYQTECQLAIEKAFEMHQSALVVMPTGSGKTETYLNYCVTRPGRSLVIGHRSFLIEQPVARLRSLGFDDVGIEMADQSVLGSALYRPKIVFATVQTVCQARRLGKFDPEDFELLITDEAHRAVSPSYRAVSNRFLQNPKLKHLGLTASPKRGDGLAMGQVFDVVAFEWGIVDATEDGWLVPCRVQSVTVDGLDFSAVKVGADGDFSTDELERIVTEEKPLHKVAASLVEIAGDEPGIVFCCSVAHARMLSAVLNRYKPQSSAWLCGESTDEERTDVLAAYAAGKVQFLCNVALFTEGFDAPRTTLIVWAAPTKSLVKYTQGFGRGTRPATEIVKALNRAKDASSRRALIAASSKPWMYSVDYVGNAGRHKVMTAADILGGRYGDLVRQYAAKLAETETEREPKAMEELLEVAASELELRRIIEEKRRAIRAAAEYRVEEGSPYGGVLPSASKVAVPTKAQLDPPPKWVCRKLVESGMSPERVANMHRTQAFTILNKIQAGAGR